MMPRYLCSKKKKKIIIVLKTVCRHSNLLKPNAITTTFLLSLSPPKPQAHDSYFAVEV